MRRLRLLVLGFVLVAVVCGVDRGVRAYQRHSERMRAQPLVTLLEDTPTAGSRLQTSKTVILADQAMVPKVRALLGRGVPANAWGETEAVFEGQKEFTPLMVAAMRRLPLTAKVLLDAGPIRTRRITMAAPP